jgi:hypothetical protein
VFAVVEAMCWRLWRLCGGCRGYVVAVAEAMWWLEEMELKQALQFSFGLGLCNRHVFLFLNGDGWKTIESLFLGVKATLNREYQGISRVSRVCLSVTKKQTING